MAARGAIAWRAADSTGLLWGRVEEALRASEANLQAIVANTSDSIASYDRERRLVACNQACREAFRRQFNVEIHPGFRAAELLLESIRGFGDYV